MKISFPHRMSSLIMALFIFISSTGISLNIHYCGEELYNFALFGQLESCKEELPVCKSDNSRIEKAGCCSFDHFKIDTDNNFEKSSSDLISESVSFDFPIISYSLLYKGITVPTYNQFILESPPEIKTNKIYIKVESFLI